jgi:hypothetical protein
MDWFFTDQVNEVSGDPQCMRGCPVEADISSEGDASSSHSVRYILFLLSASCGLYL